MLHRSANVRVHSELGGLGQRLRDVRLHRGISQREVEKLTDGALTTAGISRIETSDRKDPATSTLMSVAMALDIDIKLNRNGTITIQGTGLGGVGSGEPREAATA